jgi:hypothetical protein
MKLRVETSKVAVSTVFSTVSGSPKGITAGHAQRVSNFSVTRTPTGDKDSHLITAHIHNSRKRILQKQRYLPTELHDGLSRTIAF